MKKQRYLNLLFLICTLMSWVDAGAADSNLTLHEELQQVLDAELSRHNGIGISVAIRMPRRPPWHGVSGASDGTTPLTSSMLFGIGSVTKNFMAALILQLAEEGKLSLDDALGKYLANYANINSAITIRQLLNHTSGIFDFIKHPSIWDTIFANPLKLWKPEEILETFVLQPYFFPGTGWHYSSTNYILLGMIVKEITGSKVSAELRERFFNPLGLDSTFFDIEEPITGTIAHRWYDISGDEIPDDISFLIRNSEYSAYWTASAIFTTAADLANWSHALFRGDVLRDSSLDQMLAFHSPTTGEPLITGYGLGTIKVAPGIISGEEAIGHSGWVFGYSTAMLYFPEHDVSMAILMNKNNEIGLAEIASSLIGVVKKHLPQNGAAPWIPLLLLD